VSVSLVFSLSCLIVVRHAKKRGIILLLAVVCSFILFLVDPAVAAACPPDSVPVGPVCVDKYEASVWTIPAVNEALIEKVRQGLADLRDLTGVAEVSQHGVTDDDYGSGCPDTGNGCKDFYAISLPRVKPARFLTWFQAAAACRNARKRLLTNAEWQTAALGTPDPRTDNGSTDCNVSCANLGTTGARSSCISDAGVFDMVGNLSEWVADWVPLPTSCVSSLFGTSDVNCLAGADTAAGPGALIRGGNCFSSGSGAGVFALSGFHQPSDAAYDVGFRCGR
jgi:hypothetical protein